MSPYVNSLKVKKIQGQGPYKVDPRFSQVKKVQARDIRSLWLLIGTRFKYSVFFLKPYLSSLKVNILGLYMVHGPYRVHPRFSQVKKVQARDIRSLWLLIGTRFKYSVFFLKPYLSSLKVNILGLYMVHGPYRVHPRFSQVKKVQARDIRSLWLLI